MIAALLKKEVLLLGLLYFSSAFATDAEDFRVVEKNINETQRQLEDQVKEDIERGIGNKGGFNKLEFKVDEKEMKKDSGDGNCINITAIEYEGDDRIPLSFKEDIKAEYLNKCLTAIDIESIMSLVVNWFISEGFSTTRVYLEAQNLTAGTLKLRVQDGIVSDIILEDGGKKSIYLPSLFPFMKGKTLELTKIEQGVHQANKQRSNRATMEIESGENPGDSVVVVKNKKSYPIHLNFSIDNHGSRSTGKVQGATTITADNFIGINDILTYTHRESISEIHVNNPGESISDSLALVVPFGFFTHTFTFSKSKYESDLLTPSGTVLVSSGESINAGVTVDRVMYRNADTIINTYLRLNFNRGKNYLNGSYLAVNSKDTTTATVGTAFNSRLFNNPISFSLDFSRGLSLFGAEEAIHNLPFNFPVNLFSKIEGTISYIQSLDFMLQGLTLSSSINGQYAFDNLPSSQRISIGSRYSVRGYVENSLSGDNGSYIRNELILNNPFEIKWQDINTRINAGYDIGWVENRYDLNNSLDGWLSGGSLGLTVLWRKLAATFSYDFPLNQPSILPEESGQFWWRLNLDI
ncbi:ShlB/FhaC/HecB family hemolysin secretion/activation protein [uncultured Endozoicomonas sp.]|uniref:ShlB/FhaC/HecB family hemolysin secretion/activation protein n=1 Tax=uncultured Endozoicomonas sp. TaxID=432652 RepID=UPI002608E631|nr:ShlB/FhaC/HecB family hemolysin secretion/activation protein [uncultured Endozoicomonas sp.]